MTVDCNLTWPDDEKRTQTRSTHIFGPDFRELEKAKQTFDRSRVHWARAAAARVQPSPRPSPSRIYTQASSSPTSHDASMDLDAPPLTAGSSTSSSCSSADTPPTPISVSLFTRMDVDASPACKELARGRSAHPVRGAMHMPCVPATPQLDLTALVKRYGALGAKSTPSRAPSVTRTPSYPHA
jgi:hypothetical protein